MDEEVARSTDGSFFSAIRSDSYNFSNERDYYEDLRESKFGITTKRAGWDCLRHYEMAANGAVLCFKQLDTKPANCAPLGLDHSNCITYVNYVDLMEQIACIDEVKYKELLDNTYKWIYQHTTTASAHRFIKSCIEPPANLITNDIDFSRVF